MQNLYAVKSIFKCEDTSEVIFPVVSYNLHVNLHNSPMMDNFHVWEGGGRKYNVQCQVS